MKDSNIVLKLDSVPGNPRNSEGSFVTLADGHVLFAYTHYYGESWGDAATARICGRYSSDGGRTWSGDDAVIVENEGRQNVMSVSLLRLQNGRVGLWYLRKNSLVDCRPYMRTSRDDGTTWSRASLCIPAPGYFVVNNDRVVQSTLANAGAATSPRSSAVPRISARMTVSASAAPSFTRFTPSGYSPGPIVSVSPAARASTPFWIVA